MNDKKIAIAYVGNIYLYSVTLLKKGVVEELHAHTYDHILLLTKGSLGVESNGKCSEFKAEPIHVIFVPKEVSHRLTALEDETAYCCIHALHRRDDPGEILDPSMVPAGTPPWSLAVPLIKSNAKKEGF